MSAPEQPDWASLSSADILRYASQEVAVRQTERQDRLRMYGTGALWMATVPFTTVPLATMAGIRDVEPLVKELEQQGLVEGTLPPYLKARGENQTIYSMTAAGRSAILGKYVSEWSSGSQARLTVAEFCHRLTEPDTSSSVPEPVRRWAELAAYASDGEQLASEFDKRVQAAFDKRDGGALLDWIEAAQPLDELLQRDADQNLSSAIKRASRRVELLARRAHDERHLRGFLRREEQVEAFRALVHGPDHLWALHLFGLGGVGKTMALRHLVGELAPGEKELNAYTARIDFDYLNADYPRLEPGLLLWSFAQELRAYDDASGRATELFDKADTQLAILRQKLGAERGSRSGRPTSDPRFVDATVSFIGALRALERRVILIVDTCEELSKIRPDGTVPENVGETFRILEALHDGPGLLLRESGTASAGDGVASLRVVFAGRRPLARVGHGWTCEMSPSPEHKPYLRLHELRGFTGDDARRFLRDRVKVPEDYVGPILGKSPDVGSPAVIVWDDPKDAPLDVPRYNPYDLRFYGDWAIEDPRPTPETVANSTNADYVQVRILRRLDKLEPLRRVMPIVALVKHVDEEFLAELFPDDRSTAARVFERLRQQEWTDQRVQGSKDGTATRTVLTVEEGLRRRLCAYFAARERLNPDLLSRALDHLERVTTTLELGRLDWPVFDSALRVMELDPARGTGWWKRIERRILRDRGRGAKWLQELTGTLLAEKNAAEKVDATLALQGGRENVLRALVLAAYASTLRLTRQQTAALAASWEEVDAMSAQFVVAEQRPILRHRAKCGLLVAAAQPGPAGEPLLAAADAVFGVLPPETTAAEDAVDVAAASMAAAEALVELIEATHAGERQPLLARIDAPSGPIAFAERVAASKAAWIRALEDDAPSINSMAAFADVTAARAHAFRGEYQAADGLFTRALASGAADNAPGFIEWTPPRYIEARMKLELARTLCPAVLSAPEVLRRAMRDVVAYVPDPDVDRYLSLATSLAAAIGSSPPDRLRAFKTSALAQAMTMPVTCAAHRAVRPFFVNVERELAWQGYVDEAIATLHSAPNDSSLDVDVNLHVERALAEIVLRMRLREEGERAGGLLSESTVPDDRTLLWAIGAHGGDEGIPSVATLPGRPEWVHAVWQSIAALDDEVAAALQWAKESIPPIETATDDFIGQSLILDLDEAIALQAQTPAAAVELRTRPVNPVEFSRRHPHRPIEAFRLTLRSDALSRNVPASSHLQELATHLGPRYAARLALAEGDLLMLRLPDAAGRIFTVAADLFKEGRDPVGEFLARARIALCAPAGKRSLESSNALEAYAAMSSAQPDLALPSIAKADDLATVHQAPRGWRPWLHRLIAVLAREASAAGPSTDSYWNVGSGRRLPADLRRTVLTEASARPAQAKAAASNLRRIFEAGQNTFFFLLGLAIIGASVVFTYRGFTWITRPVVPAETSTTVRIILYSLTLVSLGLGIPWLRRRIVSALASRSTATIAFHPVETAQQSYQSRAIESEVELVVSVQRARLQWLPPAIRLDEDLPFETARARSGGLAPYKDGSASFKDGVQQLRPIASGLGSKTMSVRLQCPRDLEAPCWEGLLQLAATDDAAKLPLFRCRRIPPWTSRTVYLDAGTPALVTFASGSAAEAVVRRAWDPVRDRAGLSVVEPPADLRDFSDANVRIVHLLGRIMEGHDAVSFEIGGDAKRSTKAGREAVRNLAPEDLAYTFPRATLVIVQPPLLPRIAERDTSDRDDAMLARRFGGEVFHLGVPAVLVLPRLDAALASTASAIVARAVAQQHREGTAQLEAAVVEIQRKIRRALSEAKASPDVIHEILLDACLFCVDDWDGRLTRGRVSASDARGV